MDFQTIINLLLPYWGIIAVALGFGGYVLFQRDGAKKIILSLIIRIEKEAETLALNTGADKFQFLVDRGYQLLPTPARLLITQKMFESLAQSLYNSAKNYLVVERAKVVANDAVTPLNIVPLTSLPIDKSDSTDVQIQAESEITPIIENPETPTTPSVEPIVEIVPETPISLIPIVTSTVADAITAQITLLAQTTANTTITNIVNQTIAEALAKATQI